MPRLCCELGVISANMLLLLLLLGLPLLRLLVIGLETLLLRQLPSHSPGEVHG